MKERSRWILVVVIGMVFLSLTRNIEVVPIVSGYLEVVVSTIEHFLI